MTKENPGILLVLLTKSISVLLVILVSFVVIADTFDFHERELIELSEHDSDEKNKIEDTLPKIVWLSDEFQSLNINNTFKKGLFRYLHFKSKAHRNLPYRPPKTA